MPTRLVRDSGNNGQRWDIGTQGTFGTSASLKSAIGWTLMGWVSTSQQSVFSMSCNHSAGAESNSQSLWFMLNAGYTTDYVNLANSVLINFGDSTDTGLLWIQTINSPDFNDGGTYHHAVTVIATGTAAGSNSSATIVWYVNGIPFTSWTKKFSDGLNNLAVAWPNQVSIGAHLKSGGGQFDYSTGDYEDFRIYQRALSADEVLQIHRLKGRDTIRRNLLSRYSFFNDGRNTGPNGTVATATNDGTLGNPTILTTKFCSGVRRKVM